MFQFCRTNDNNIMINHNIIHILRIELRYFAHKTNELTIILYVFVFVIKKNIQNAQFTI